MRSSTQETSVTHIVFVVHELSPRHGYVYYRYKEAGRYPDPQGSDPLLGETPETIIERRLANLSKELESPVTHEVIVHEVVQK